MNNSAEKKVKKYGFFFSLIMMIGAIVGISIFFKNGQVFAAVNGDSTLIISAWVTGAVVAFLTAMSFLDVSRLRQNSKMPFRKWCSMFVSKRYSNFVGTIALLYAYSLVLPVLYYYCYSFLVQAFGGVPTLEGGVVALIIIPLGLFFLNMKAESGSAFFTKVTTVLKVFPLILTGLVGLFFTSNGGGVDVNATTTLFGGEKPSSIALLFALPAILFSFDGFLTVTNIAHKTKNSKKNIPLAMILGMLFVTILYILVTIAQVNHASPLISTALQRIFKNDAWVRVTLFFVAISAFGVSNIVTMSAKITCQSIIDDDVLPFSWWYKKKFDSKKDHGGGFVMLGVVIFSGLLIMLIQSAVIGSGLMDKLVSEKRVNFDESRRVTFIIDEFSNYPTYFFYPIYLSVIFANKVALIRGKIRKGATEEEKNEFKELYSNLSNKRKNTTIVFSILSSAAITGMICIYFFYNIVYERIILPFTSKGYLSNGEEIDVIIFFVNLALVLFIPFFCHYLNKLDKKKRQDGYIFKQKKDKKDKIHID